MGLARGGGGMVTRRLFAIARQQNIREQGNELSQRHFDSTSSRFKYTNQVRKMPRRRRCGIGSSDMFAPVAVAAQPLAEGFTYTNALGALLTTEGLLFAALGLAANLSTAGGRRVRRLPVSGQVLGGVAVGALVIVALGATAAWLKVFASDFPSELSGVVIAVALIVAIVVQPTLAVLLGLGLRTAT